MTVWQVWDGDYDGDWVLAAYATEELAKAHSAAYPRKRYQVEPAEVLNELAADVVKHLEKKGRDRT